MDGQLLIENGWTVMSVHVERLMHLDAFGTSFHDKQKIATGQEQTVFEKSDVAEVFDRIRGSHAFRMQTEEGAEDLVDEDPDELKCTMAEDAARRRAQNPLHKNEPNPAVDEAVKELFAEEEGVAPDPMDHFKPRNGRTTLAEALRDMRHWSLAKTIWCGFCAI